MASATSSVSTTNPPPQTTAPATRKNGQKTPAPGKALAVGTGIAGGLLGTAAFGPVGGLAVGLATGLSTKAIVENKKNKQ